MCDPDRQIDRRVAVVDDFRDGDTIRAVVHLELLQDIHMPLRDSNRLDIHTVAGFGYVEGPQSPEVMGVFRIWRGTQSGNRGLYTQIGSGWNFPRTSQQNYQDSQQDCYCCQTGTFKRHQTFLLDHDRSLDVQQKKRDVRRAYFKTQMNCVFLSRT